MSALPNYEVYAIRYATRAAKRSDNFIGGDPHDGPMPLDYYVWAAIGPDRSYVIDTGFTAEIKPGRSTRASRSRGSPATRSDGRSSKLRAACEKAGKGYVLVFVGHAVCTWFGSVDVGVSARG